MRNLFIIALIVLPLLGCSKINVALFQKNHNSKSSPLITLASQIDTGESVPLEIQGGVEPYQFSVSSNATIDPDTKTLTVNPTNTSSNVVVTVTDATGNSSTQTIPVRIPNVNLQMINEPDTTAQFNIKDLSFAPNGEILMGGSHSSNGYWRVDKIKSTFSDAPIFLDTYMREPERGDEANVVLAYSDSVYFAAGFNDGPSLQDSITIRRSIDSGKNWATVYILAPEGLGNKPKTIIADKYGTIYVLTGQRILKSTNLGNTWTSIVKVGNNLIVAPDGETLYLAGSSDGQATISYSTDGALTWSAPLNYAGPSTQTNAYSIAIKDSLMCWAGRDGNQVGGSLNMKWIVQCTANNGGTWTGFVSTVGSGNSAGSIIIASNGDIFINASGVIKKSSDNAVSWQNVAVPVGFSAVKLEKDPNNNLYILGKKNGISILKSADNGITWTEWNHQYSIPSYTAGSSITKNENGIIFTSGYYQYQWSIKKSMDNGTTWMEAYSEAGSDGHYSTIKAVGNNVFSIGQAYPNYWKLIKSTDDGATWSSADNFTCTAGDPRGLDITSTQGGAIFVVGDCTSSGVSTAIIRRSLDNGLSWTTVDSFQLSAGKSSQYKSITALPTGELIAFGYGVHSSDTPYWIIRKSSDGGNSWSTIDSSIQYHNVNLEMKTLKITSDSNRIIIAGSATISGVPQLLLRQSVDKGNSWSNLLEKPNAIGVAYQEPDTLFLVNGTLYLSYVEKLSNGEISPYALEKTRNFTDWYKISSGNGGNIRELIECGSAICGIGNINSQFSQNMWMNIKIE